MDQILKQRLDILEMAGEITEAIKNTVISFSESLEEKYSITMDEENGAMLVTHLAMALARIKKGEEVNEMDDFALEEVKQSKIYNELPKFYKAIEKKLDIEIPESEKGFIALHSIVLVNKQK